MDELPEESLEKYPPAWADYDWNEYDQDDFDDYYKNKWQAIALVQRVVRTKSL